MEKRLKRRYNERAQSWQDEGIAEFDNLSFSITDSGKDHSFAKSTEVPGIYYPCRDSCNQKGDPASGCVYTGDLHYYHLMMMLDTNHIILKDSDQNVIIETRFNSSAISYRTAKEMSCANSLYVFHVRLLSLEIVARISATIWADSGT